MYDLNRKYPTKIFSIYIPIQNSTPIVAPTYHRGLDLNKFESTLHGDASTQISLFLENWFLGRYLKSFLFILFRKISTLFWAKSLPHDHELNKLESSLPRNASTQITTFWTYRL